LDLDVLEHLLSSVIDRRRRPIGFPRERFTRGTSFPSRISQAHDLMTGGYQFFENLSWAVLVRILKDHIEATGLCGN